MCVCMIDTSKKEIEEREDEDGGTKGGGNKGGKQKSERCDQLHPEL